MKAPFYKLNILLTICLVLNSCTQEDVAVPLNLLVGWKEETLGKVQFTNLTDNADSFLWEFDDKTTSTEKTPVKIYSQNGEYQVKVTATKGKKSTIQNLTVKVKTVVLPLVEFQNSTNGSLFRLIMSSYFGGGDFRAISGLEWVTYSDNPPSPKLLTNCLDCPDPILEFSGFTKENIKTITKTDITDGYVNKYTLTFDKPFEIKVSRADKGNYAIIMNRAGDKQLCNSILYKGNSLVFEGSFGYEDKDAVFFQKVIQNTPKRIEEQQLNIFVRVMRCFEY